MVIGTGKLFTVLAMAGGSGVFCQDYKSNPAKALPSFPSGLQLLVSLQLKVSDGQPSLLSQL